MIGMIDTEPTKVVVPVEIKSREDIKMIVEKAELLTALVETTKKLAEEIAQDVADFKVDHPQVVPKSEKTGWEEDYFGPIGYVEERTKALFRKKVENYENE